MGSTRTRLPGITLRDAAPTDATGTRHKLPLRWTSQESPEVQTARFRFANTNDFEQSAFASLTGNTRHLACPYVETDCVLRALGHRGLLLSDYRSSIPSSIPPTIVGLALCCRRPSDCR